MLHFGLVGLQIITLCLLFTAALRLSWWLLVVLVGFTATGVVGV